MPESQPFFVVGENIHCTLVYKTTGNFVKELPTGAAIRYTEGGQERLVPIPPAYTSSEEWTKGNVKHVAVAVWQGLHGEPSAREAASAYLRHLARRQEEAGASFLDLNVDELSTDVGERREAMQWAAGVVQGATRLPLSIDSSNLEILRSGLHACERARGKPMVNSVSLERLPAVEVAREGDAVVLAGATGTTSMPKDTEERTANLSALMEHLRAAGFSPGEVYLDPLVFPVSVDPSNGLYLVRAIEALRRSLGTEVHFAPGLSNVSFGMPNRKLLNQVFAWICRQAGMDGAIANPLHINAGVLDALDPTDPQFRLARDFLLSEDAYGMEYIAASRDGRI